MRGGRVEVAGGVAWVVSMHKLRAVPWCCYTDLQLATSIAPTWQAALCLLVGQSSLLVQETMSMMKGTAIKYLLWSV